MAAKPTFLILAAFLAAIPTFAQTPAVSDIRNAASFEAKLSPGALAAVYGSNFGTSTNIPVTVGGRPAAVIAATANQLNIQLPFDVPVGATTIQVGSSAPFSFTLAQYAPALFTANQAGTGIVSAFHANFAPVTLSNPAAPGETITIYATGLGPTNPAVAAGTSAPSNPLAVTVASPTATVGGVAATVTASVLSPGQVGAYAVNIRLSSEPVNAVRPIVLSIGGISSNNTTTLPVGTTSVRQSPVINGVVSATGIPGSVQSTIQSGSWVAIYGFDLALNIGDWTSVLQLPSLPTTLAGVSVTIDGKPAAVYFISPGQINVQAPDTAAGPVQVVVTNNGLASAPFTAQLRTHAPAFFQWGATKYAVASRHPDNAFVGPSSISTSFVSARSNDVLVLWATGFGPTVPPVPAGIVVPSFGVSETATPVTVTVNGVGARVFAAALSPGLAGVYQIAIQLPTALPTGDVLVKATVAGFSTPDNVYLNIAN